MKPERPRSPLFRIIRFARVPRSKLFMSTDSFVYAQTSLMSLKHSNSTSEVVMAKRHTQKKNPQLFFFFQ